MSKSDDQTEEEPTMTKQAKGPATEPTTDLSKAQADLSAVTGERDTLQKSLARSNAVVALNKSERAYFDGLESKAQDDFLAADADDRAELVKTAEEANADANAVAYTSDDGEVFTKSDDTRLVKMAKAADRQGRELKKAREEADMEGFRKTARTELPHLVGTDDDKGMLLSLIAKHAPEDQREDLTAILKAQASAFELGSDFVGTEQEPDASSPEGQLHAMAKTRQAKHGGTIEQASAAVMETPEGLELLAQMD